MGVKKAGVFLGSLFLMVFLLGVVSAQDGCWIENRADCLEADTPSEYIIMGLSGPTNAHGEVVQFNAQNKIRCLGTPHSCSTWSSEGGFICVSHGCTWIQALNMCMEPADPCSDFDDDEPGCINHGCSYGVNYDYVLCCNFGNGIQPAGCGAAATDDILLLSSTTNAHAEVPEGTTYTTEVCYENMACVNGTENPNSDIYTPILSLSGTTGTNAHIGGPNDYDTKIYCQVDFSGTNLCLGGAPNNIREGSEECDNDQDPHCIIDFCECEGGYEYNPLTEVCEYIAGPLEAYWASSETTDSYLYTEELYIGYTTIYMILKNSGLSQGTVVSFEIFEADTFPNPDDDIKVGTDARKGIVDSIGKVVGNWTVSYTDWQNADDFLEGDEYEFYFKVDDIKSNELTATVKEAPFCPTISLCLDYSASDSCVKDTCERAAFSVELNSDITCGGDIICECWWDTTTGKCNSRWGDGTGWCEYTETIQDECTEENLFLTYTITANWDNSGEELPPDCVGGSNAVPCPAQIQLPFFNIYNIIAIIVVIVLIYFLLNLKKKKRKVSKKKK